MARLDWRKPITVQLRYRHGAEPYVEVKCRGREYAYPWDVSILDVLRDVNNRNGW